MTIRILIRIRKVNHIYEYIRLDYAACMFLYLSNINVILYFTFHPLSVCLDILPAFDYKLDWKFDILQQLLTIIAD